jgi:hypothetical protein
VRAQRPQQQRRTIADEDDVLSDDEGPATGIEQQLAQYEAEPRHLLNVSPRTLLYIMSISL